MDKNLLADYLKQAIKAVPDVVPLLSPSALRLLDNKTIKAADNLPAIKSQYNSAIIEILVGYFENGGAVTTAKNKFRRTANDAIGAAFDLGWMDGGQEMPPDEDALAWLDARIEQEFGNIAALFEQAKQLRKEDGFDFFSYVTQKADGYTRTINDIYDMGVLFASKNKMLTFDGKDGSPDNICQKNNGTCVKLKGKRHKASWWIARDLVPYRGNKNYDCGAWECHHYLRDDEGNKFTT